MGGRLAWLLQLALMAPALGASPADAAGLSGPSPQAAAPYEEGPGSPIAPVLKVESAVYDGRLLSLDVRVPSAGALRIGLPVKCTRNDADCHRRAWVSRQSRERGVLTIRKALKPRLGRDGRMTAALRFDGPQGMSIQRQAFGVHIAPAGR